METTLENPSATLTNGGYAGFWIRFVAYVIDGILLSVVYLLILGAVGFGSLSGSEDLMSSIPAFMAGAGMLIQLALTAVGLLYFVLMEASAKQGTFGKMILGLKVVGQDGQRIGVGQAILRYIGKIISGAILMIGFLMAAFTDKKRALHDMIAGTYVIKN